MYKNFFKRLFDFLGALFLIVALATIYVILYILIRINMGSPVFFRQDRPGKNGKIFKLMKFRSMNSAADENGKLLPDAKRLTKLGSFLCKSSLDEIPQFFNVLRGDMSFIGPRPLLAQYIPYYTARESRRHEVRPGITGLAQVSGRNNITWAKKLECDAEYVENLSLLLDVKIALLTVMKVLRRADVAVGAEEAFDVVRRRELEAKETKN